MRHFRLFYILCSKCFSKEQYPWWGSREIDADVEILLKQGLKIGYLPKSTTNGKNQIFKRRKKIFIEVNRLANEGDTLLGRVRQ